MDDMMSRWQQFAMSVPHIASATGNPVTIMIAEPKIEKLQVNFAAQQTSDNPPSRNNVVPIVGVNQVSAVIGSDTKTKSLEGMYYGGTVDMVSGQLSLTHSYVVFNGNQYEDWTASQMDYLGTKFTINLPDADSSAGSDILCNMAQSCIPSEFDVGKCYISQTKDFTIAFDMLDVTTATEFKQWLSQHNLQLVFKLTTPISTAIDPSIILANRGSQTVTTGYGNVLINYWTH